MGVLPLNYASWVFDGWMEGWGVYVGGDGKRVWGSEEVGEEVGTWVGWWRGSEVKGGGGRSG